MYRTEGLSIEKLNHFKKMTEYYFCKRKLQEDFKNKLEIMIILLGNFMILHIVDVIFNSR